MAGNNTVKIDLQVASQGMDPAVAKSQTIKDNLTAASTAMGKVGGTAGSRAVAEGRAYGTSRAVGGGTGAAGRDFAKESQGLGGLVRLYATVAANTFAAAAAFRALSDAMNTANMVKGLDQLGAASGRSLGGLARQLTETADGAINLRDSMQAVAQASSAGMGGASILQMGEVAKKASQALGISMPDAISRLSRGITKLEPELLDELGIFTKLDKSTQDYALSVGKTAATLTDFERRQAFANAVLKEGTDKFSNIKIDANPYDKLLASTQNLAASTLNLVNTALGPLVKILSESPVALAGVLGALAFTLVKQAIPAISQWRGSMVKAADDAAKVAKRISSAYDDFDIGKKTAKGMAELRAATDATAKHIETVQKSLAKGSTRTDAFKQLSSPDYDPASNQKNIDRLVSSSGSKLAALQKERQDIIKYAGQAELDLIDKKIQKEQQLYEFRKKAAAENMAAINAQAAVVKAKSNLDSIENQTVEGKRKETIAARAGAKAERLGILSNVGITAEEKGSAAAWARLKDEVKNGRGVFDEFGTRTETLGKGLKGVAAATTLVAGGFRIASVAIAETMTVLAPYIAILTLAAAAFGALDSWLSTAKEEQDKFTASLKGGDEAAKTVNSTLDFIAKKKKDVFGTESITALSNALNGITESLLGQVDAYEKVTRAQSPWEKFWDGAWSKVGRGNIDKLTDSISKDIPAAISAMLLDPKLKETQEKLGKILQINPDSISEKSVSVALKALSSDTERVRVGTELNEVLSAANKQNQNSTAALQAFEAGLVNVGKEVDSLNNKLAFTDSQGKMGLGLVQEAQSLAEALKDPIKGMEALYKLATNAKTLSLLPPKASADLIKLIPELNKTKDEFDKLGKQLLTTKSRLAELGVSSDVIEQTAKRGTGQVDSTQFFKKGTKQYEQAQLLDSLKPAQDAFNTMKADIIKNQKAANDAVASITEAGMEQLRASLKFSKEQASISIARSQLSITTAAEGPVAADELKLKQQESSIQQRLIDANYNSALRVEENTAAIEQANALNSLALAQRQKAEAAPGSAAELAAKQAIEAASTTLAKLELVASKGKEKELRDKKAKSSESGSSGLDESERAALQVFDRQKIIRMGRDAAQAQLNAKNAEDKIQAEIKQISEDRQARDKKIVQERELYSATLSDISNREKFVGIYTESIAAERKRVELINLELDYRQSQSANAAQQALIDKELNIAKKKEMQSRLDYKKSVEESKYGAARTGVEQAFSTTQFAEKQKAQAQTDSTNLKIAQDKNALLILNNSIEEQRLSTAQALNQIDEVTFIRLKETIELQKQEQNNQLAILQAEAALRALKNEAANNAKRDAEERKQQVELYGTDAGLVATDTTARDRNLQERTQAAESGLNLAQETARVQPLITKALADQNVELANQKAHFADIAQSVNSLSAVFGSFGKALGASVQGMENLAKATADRAKEQKKADDAAKNASPEKRLELEKNAETLRKRNAKSELSDIGTLAGTTKKAFGEKTAAYKALHAVEKTMHVLSLAMQAEQLAATLMSIPAKIAGGVANMFAQGGFAGFAGAAAFLALMASLGHGGGSAPSMPSAEDKQKVQGTGQGYVDGKVVDIGGGIPGDPTGKADSLNKALDILVKYEYKEVEYSNKMLEALKAIKMNTSNLGTLLMSSLGGTAATRRRSQTMETGEIRGNASLGVAGTAAGMVAGGFAGFAAGMAAEWALMGAAISSSISTAVMAAMGPVGLVLGVLLGGTINKVIGSIFGGKTTMALRDFGISVKGSVDQLSDATNNLVKEYADYTKTVKGGWFRSNKVSNVRVGGDANAQIQELFADSIKSSKTALVEAGKVLGDDPAIISSILGGLQLAFEVSLKDLKPEEAAKALEAEFSRQMNLMAETAELGWIKFKKFANAGEEAGEAVIRLARDVQVFDITMNSLGNSTTLAIKGLDKLEIVEPMIKAAGGLENFTKQAQQFAGDFMTESERLIPVQKALTAGLEAIGLSGDTTAETYKSLVLGADRTTAAGRKLYQDLMNLEPAMKLVSEAAKKTRSLEIDLMEAEGHKAEAIAARREIEYASMSATDAALKRRIDRLNDEKVLLDAKGTQEEKIYQLLGKTDKATQLMRERQLNGMDVSLRASQRYIYALEDEAIARNAATKAIQDTINITANSIKTLTEYSNSLATGSQGNLTPEQKYMAQKQEFQSLLERAKGPQDTEEGRKAAADAAAKLPSVGNALLESAKTLYASGDQYTGALDMVRESIGSTIDSLAGTKSTAEQQLAEIQNQTSVMQSIDTSTKTTAQYLEEFFKAAGDSAIAKAGAAASGSVAAGGVAPIVSLPSGFLGSDPEFQKAAEKAAADMAMQTAIIKENNLILTQQLQEAREATAALIRSNAEAMQAQTEALAKATADAIAAADYAARTQPVHPSEQG